MASKTYPEYGLQNLPELETRILQFWKENKIFEKSISNRDGEKPFVFYEGPPSANGLPGIHHVISRALKDVFCRYKTLQGYQVDRKAGWDTHGLPIELQVEKSLGITKDDIGEKISVEDYNKACRRDVLKFKDTWDLLTEKIGYWVDLEHPYITYENNYIETVWYLLKELYKKDFLYKGYTIQPYSPAAGTGLSSHELNQPGTYKDVKDTTVVAQFKLKNPQSIGLDSDWSDVYCLAWTTTPWTLPSNTALGVGKKIDYSVVRTFNIYTGLPVTVILAADLVPKYFKDEGKNEPLKDYSAGNKIVPWEVVKNIKGAELEGLKYEQLMPYVQPDGDAFKIIVADFVTTEDGTGIVHLAPSFGADDFRAASQNNIAALTLVDKKGKFIDTAGDLAGKYVKNYLDEDESAPDYQSTDVYIAIKLKESNKAFKVEKYEHSYPHCWRTDKPILYYPLESWFIRTTAVKDKLIENNNKINWKPASTGVGRFGNWLENLVDWNLSRSRYWGTPLPVWRSDNGEEKCIGSIEELRSEIKKALDAGVMDSDPFEGRELDLHRPYIDRVVLLSDQGKPMYRESDLIDVWFDSGAMPYAQLHYPFENKDLIDNHKAFPADFIAEGVDQTRGWFFTLHVIGTMLFDSVAYKNVMANGLVLDKNGNKMSKRLGNTVDPFDTIDKYGADVVRWYMLSNAAPWENLKFSMDGLDETRRKFFGTLQNVYSFFALYANIDDYTGEEKYIPVEDRPELDKWILSLLNSLVKDVQNNMDQYEPTKATRAIQDFTIDHLSNWYVRLGRRRFWKGERGNDKVSAYQTLAECLEKISILMASFAPFYADQLYQDMKAAIGKRAKSSVHLEDYPSVNEKYIDKHLEEKMEIAQDISSMILAIRKKEQIKVRQPLAKIMVPVHTEDFRQSLKEVEHIILQEVNVKELEYLDDNSEVHIVKNIKPNFKVLGKKAGRYMKEIAGLIGELGQGQIENIEAGEPFDLRLGDGEVFTIQQEDVEISSTDMPGWLVESNGRITVALDITITEDLEAEGFARELVNRLQNLRKDKGFDVTDKIIVTLNTGGKLKESVTRFNDYICAEILASKINFTEEQGLTDEIDVNGISTKVEINKSI